MTLTSFPCCDYPRITLTSLGHSTLHVPTCILGTLTTLCLRWSPSLPRSLYLDGLISLTTWTAILHQAGTVAGGNLFWIATYGTIIFFVQVRVKANPKGVGAGAYDSRRCTLENPSLLSSIAHWASAWYFWVCCSALPSAYLGTFLRGMCLAPQRFHALILGSSLWEFVLCHALPRAYPGTLLRDLSWHCASARLFGNLSVRLLTGSFLNSFSFRGIPSQVSLTGLPPQ